MWYCSMAGESLPFLFAIVGCEYSKHTILRIYVGVIHESTAVHLQNIPSNPSPATIIQVVTHFSVIPSSIPPVIPSVARNLILPIPNHFSMMLYRRQMHMGENLKVLLQYDKYIEFFCILWYDK